MNERMRKAMESAARVGRARGRRRALQFVAGHTGELDLEAIVHIADRINAGDPITVELVKSFAEDGTEDYYPNIIAVRTSMLDRTDSRYTDYLEICEAYDTAVLEGAKEELTALANAIRGEGS